MKKINYIETEEKLEAAGHGVEFHYKPLTNDRGKMIPGEPVAILEFDGWWNNKSEPIRVRIHPASSPTLKAMGDNPETIIAEVKEAIERVLRRKHVRDGHPVTEHVWTWING